MNTNPHEQLSAMELCIENLWSYVTNNGYRVNDPVIYRTTVERIVRDHWPQSPAQPVPSEPTALAGGKTLGQIAHAGWKWRSKDKWELLIPEDKTEWEEIAQVVANAATEALRKELIASRQEQQDEIDLKQACINGQRNDLDALRADNERLREALATSRRFYEAKIGCENCDPDNECYFDCMTAIADAEKEWRSATEQTLAKKDV